MLDAISDFWKPLKKSQPPVEKLKPEQLQPGSTIGFGFVPQASLSGRKLQVSAVNTYRFGDETLTSFALSHDKDASVSMIVAESEGEQYLAISRRLTINDRMRMFDSHDLENIMEKEDITNLSCKDIPSDFKGWMVLSYKREINGLDGAFIKGDFRKQPISGEAQNFKYTLLVSDANEHAIEIEKYEGGRIEVYATVYRRLSDVSEVTPPARVELNRPDLKLASQKEEALKPPAPVKSEIKAEPVKLKEFSQTGAPVAMQPKSDPKITAPVTQTPASAPKAESPKAPAPKKEEKPMQTETATNGAGPMKAAEKPKLANVSAPAQDNKQEVKAVSKTMNGLDNESIECDLKVANKIIDEAIRNEMRLSDVVRRIIELPVSHQEAVHIPVVLSDEDFSLLAIRYGVSPSDRAAIKARIIEDLNGFSGNSKKAA